MSHIQTQIRPDKAAPIEIREWLEWAGSKLLSMSLSSPLPGGYRTYWPEFAQSATEAYGYTGERLRPSRPGSKEIELMDRILLFPSNIHDDVTRRIINSRALVTPISNRYVYSWSKLAFMLHCDKRRVVRLHYLGLCEIAHCLSPDNVDAIRQLLPPIAN